MVTLRKNIKQIITFTIIIVSNKDILEIKYYMLCNINSN